MIGTIHRLVATHFQETAKEWLRLYSRKDVYAWMYQYRRDVVLQLVDSLSLPAREKMLEVGCGPGLVAVELARQGYSVYGIDVAPAMIELTRQLAAESGVAVQTLVSDVCGIPFADRTFRLVLAVGVTEWINPLEPAINELARAVAPGGYLIVTTDNRWALYRLLDPILNPLLDPLKKLIRRSERKPRPTVYSRRRFNAALENSGLRLISGVTLGFGPFSLFRWPVLSDRLAIRVHQKLQRAADNGMRALRQGGHVYVALARKDNAVRGGIQQYAREAEYADHPDIRGRPEGSKENNMNKQKKHSHTFRDGGLMMGSAIAFAHKGVEHFMGTVTAVTDTSITVDTARHKMVTVKVDPSTTFTNKDTKASLADMKVGDRVVINAREIGDEMLQAVSVKWGASSSVTARHADHK